MSGVPIVPHTRSCQARHGFLRPDAVSLEDRFPDNEHFDGSVREFRQDGLNCGGPPQTILVRSRAASNSFSNCLSAAASSSRNGCAADAAAKPMKRRSTRRVKFSLYAQPSRGEGFWLPLQ